MSHEPWDLFLAMLLTPCGTLMSLSPFFPLIEGDDIHPPGKTLGDLVMTGAKCSMWAHIRQLRERAESRGQSQSAVTLVYVWSKSRCLGVPPGLYGCS